MKKILGLVVLLTAATLAHAQSTFNKYQPANGVQCNTGLTFIDTACTASQIPAPGSSTQMIYNLSGALTGNAQATVASDLGVLLGAPTGGSKGPGTLNATALYINGAAVGTSSGAVSSVGLSLPGIFTVTGSPVTAAGTLTGSLNTQSANLVWAGPTTGAAATPAFRSLVTADFPTSGVTAGSCTYCAITFDATGRATAQSSGTAPASAANPTGSIGLTTVNGTATTFMRSDGHPALDQSISPTMTGTWTFSNTSNPVTFNNATAGSNIQNMCNTSNASGQQCFDIRMGSTGTFTLSSATDAGVNGDPALQIGRTGTALNIIQLGNTTDYPAITLDGPTTINLSTGVGLTVNEANGAGIAIVSPSGASQTGYQRFAGTSSGSVVENFYEGVNVFSSDGSFDIASATATAINVKEAGNVSIANPTSGTTLTITNAAATTDAIHFANGGTRVWLMGPGSGTGADDFALLYDGTRNSTVIRASNTGAVTIVAPSGNPFAVCTTTSCGSTLFQVTNAGSVGMPGLGTSTAAQTGYLCWSNSGGALTVDSTNTCLVSSIRYKKNVLPLDLGLDAVMKLRPITYEYKDGFMPDKFNPGRQDGFIAEEVQKVDPRLVPLDSEGKPKSVEYAQMTALLTRAIQDQQQEIWELKLALGALAVVTLTWLSALTWKRRRHG